MIGRRRLQRYQQRKKSLLFHVSLSAGNSSQAHRAQQNVFTVAGARNAPQCTTLRTLLQSCDFLPDTGEQKRSAGGCLFAGATRVRLYCLSVSVCAQEDKEETGGVAAWRLPRRRRQRLTKSSLAATLGSALRAPSRLCTTRAFTVSLEGWR